MSIKLWLLLLAGLAMIAAGLVTIRCQNEPVRSHLSRQSEVAPQADVPQYSAQTVIEMALDYLKAQYYPEIENKIASAEAEYLGRGLWKVEFYARESPRTCPRRADIPAMIVYVNEETGTID